MADIQQEVLIKVNTDTSQAAQGVNDLKNNLADVNNTQIDKPFQSFRAQIKEAINDAKQLQEQFGANSQQFKDAIQNVANLRKGFQDFNEEVKAFNPANKFAALSSVAHGSVGSIEGVVGAMTFLNGVSKDNEETIRRLQGLLVFSSALGDIEQFQRGFKNLGTVIQQTTTFQKANNAVTSIAAGIQRLFGVAVDETAVSFNILKGAIAATGIGLLIVGIGLLIENWNKLTDSLSLVSEKQKIVNSTLDDAAKDASKAQEKILGVQTAFQEFADGTLTKKEALDKYNDTLGETFGKTNDIAKAEKYVAEKAPIYLQITLLKAQANLLLQKSAEQTVKALTASHEDNIGWWAKTKAAFASFVGSYGLSSAILINAQIKNTKAIQDSANADAASFEKLATQISEKADALAKGNNINLDNGKKDKKTKKNDEQRKRDLEEIKKDNEDAAKDLAQINDTAREKELDNLNRSFQEKLKLFQKYHIDTTKITEDNAAQRNAINKKYNDEYVQFIKANSLSIESEYDKQVDEINKKIDDEIKAFPEKAAELNKLRQELLGNANDENTLKNNSTKAQTNEINTERNDASNKDDSPDAAKSKIDEIAKAKQEAEEAAYELEYEQKKTNAAELEKLEAQHQTNLVKITTDASKAKAEIDKKEADEKKALFDETGKALNAFSDLLGKQSVAGKALSVANATVNMFEAISRDLKLGFPANIIPIATDTAVGLSAIKNILAVKIPNQASSSASPSNLAPSINATAAQAPTTQDVRVTNTPAQQPVRAYITNSDLSNNETKNKFLNQVSTY